MKSCRPSLWHLTAKSTEWSYHETADGEDLLSLFNQYSTLISPNLYWLATEDAVIINKVSIEGISATVTVQQCAKTALFDTCANMSVILQKFFYSLPQQLKLLTSNTCKVMSANGIDLVPIGYCCLIFQLGKKHFTDKLIVLQNLWRDLILSLNWQSNYKISCNWNINGHHYITHDNTYLCTSILLTIAKLIVCNAGAFYLQPTGISIITVWVPTKLKPQYIYELSTSNDIPSELIPLAIDHKTNNKYPRLLNIPILNMTHSRVYIPKSTIFGALKPVKMNSAEISETSWTKITNS